MRDAFDEFEIKLESSTGKTQLDLYLEEANLDRITNSNLDVLGYWKDNMQRYPEPSLMARDILSVPITTVASEFAFSIDGRVIESFEILFFPQMPRQNYVLEIGFVEEKILMMDPTLMKKMILLLIFNLILRNLEWCKKKELQCEFANDKMDEGTRR